MTAASYHGLNFELDPAEAVDGAMLFYPHIYLRRERQWLERVVRADDVFVDGGAYLGVFSLLAERLGARAIAVEANPETFVRLQKSLAINRSQAMALNVGLSDRWETLDFYPQRSGNAGGASFIRGTGDTFRVQCMPLIETAPKCDVLKLDVEGMEWRVLSAYLPRHRPRAVILEAFGETDALRLCRQQGYKLADRTAENCLLLRT